MDQNKKQSTKSQQLKNRRREQIIAKQAHRITMRRVFLIACGVVAIIICFVLLAHHSVTRNHTQSVRQAKQTRIVQKRNRQELRQHTKSVRNHARKANYQYRHHPSARQQKLKTLIQSMNQGFAQRKANVRAHYSPSTNILDYEIVGPLAKNWQKAIDLQQKSPIQMKMSESKYRKRLAKATTKHDRIYETINKLHAKIQKAVKDPQLTFRITPVKHYVSLSR